MADQERTSGKPNRSRQVVEDYEPPGIEKVLTPAELEREILYAGDDDLTADQ